MARAPVAARVFLLHTDFYAAVEVEDSSALAIRLSLAKPEAQAGSQARAAFAACPKAALLALLMPLVLLPLLRLLLLAPVGAALLLGRRGRGAAVAATAIGWGPLGIVVVACTVLGLPSSTGGAGSCNRGSSCLLRASSRLVHHVDAARTCQSCRQSTPGAAWGPSS
jgi:hypothetical protein